MDTKVRQSAEQTFKAHPQADKIFVTTDGHSFMPQAKNMADFHARRNGLKVIEITRDELSAKAPAKAPAKDAGSGEGVADVKSMNRSQLDDQLKDRGLNPEDYANKAACIEAIEQHDKAKKPKE